jgi:hypothetical protein
VRARTPEVVQVVPEVVSPPESEQTTSNNFKLSKTLGKICSATTLAGHPCRAFARAGLEFCLYHDPEFASERRARAAAGGRKNRKAEPAPGPGPDRIIMNLGDPGSVQAAIDGIFRMHLNGQVPHRRSAAIVRLLALAVRNIGRRDDFPLPDFEGAYMDGGRPWVHNPGLIETKLQFDEMHRQLEEIGTAKARREVWLQANEAFNYPYRTEKR